MTTSHDDVAVREIVTGTPPTRFARGWHCLGQQSEFTDGKPPAVDAFGTKLVVWADDQGEVKILDAYCGTWAATSRRAA